MKKKESPLINLRISEVSKNIYLGLTVSHYVSFDNLRNPLFFTLNFKSNFKWNNSKDI